MDKDQILAAADETLRIARDLNMDTLSSDTPMIDYDHLLVMRGKMADMDDLGKLNRWLGWMQAAVYSHSFDAAPEDVFERLRQCNTVT